MYISEQYLQKCRSNALDNNDLVTFTSSRGDNSVTNDSMVMKLAYAELYTTSNIVTSYVHKLYVYISEQYVQNCRRKAPDKIVPTDGRTDRRTDSHGDSSIPTPLRCGGIIIKSNSFYSSPVIMAG